MFQNYSFLALTTSTSSKTKPHYFTVSIVHPGNNCSLCELESSILRVKPVRIPLVLIDLLYKNDDK